MLSFSLSFSHLALEKGTHDNVSVSEFFWCYPRFYIKKENALLTSYFKINCDDLAMQVHKNWFPKFTKAEQKPVNGEQYWQGGKCLVVVWSTYWPWGIFATAKHSVDGRRQPSAGGLWKCTLGRFSRFVYNWFYWGRGFIVSQRRHCGPLLSSDVEFITSCFSGSGYEGKGERQWDDIDCFHCSAKLCADFQGQN